MLRNCSSALDESTAAAETGRSVVSGRALSCVWGGVTTARVVTPARRAWLAAARAGATGFPANADLADPLAEVLCATHLARDAEADAATISPDLRALDTNWCTGAGVGGRTLDRVTRLRERGRCVCGGMTRDVSETQRTPRGTDQVWILRSFPRKRASALEHTSVLFPTIGEKPRVVTRGEKGPGSESSPANQNRAKGDSRKKSLRAFSQ